MFARTSRLLLRPAFAEDAPALKALLATESLVHDVAAPASSARDAEALLFGTSDPILPSFLILRRTEAAPLLIGACGLSRRLSGTVELGYWIVRQFRGQAYATEACSAVIEIAAMLGLPSIVASHFVGDRASARLLEKLGFQPVGVSGAKAARAA
jgi:RimJ/RimL family protein N-acetyltransferase